MINDESHTVLSNLTPGVTYQVTVIAVKGQRESEPGSDSLTTGTVGLKYTHTHTLLQVFTEVLS